MGLRSGTCACGQNKFLQPWQLRVVVRQCLVQLQQRVVLEQFVTGHGQLPAQVEQLVLDIDQQLAHIIGQHLAQQQADVRVELVHITHGMGAAAGLGDTGVVTQAGGAIVTGSGRNLGESVAHG